MFGNDLDFKVFPTYLFIAQELHLPPHPAIVTLLPPAPANIPLHHLQQTTHYHQPAPAKTPAPN
jgi:hypothetical protein